MRLSVIFVLAYATLSFSIPSPRTAQILTLVEKRLNGVHSKESLSLSVADRQSGLNGIPCSEDGDCAGDRQCFSISNGAIVACSGQCVCFSSNISDLSCSSDIQCDAGESCVATQGAQGSICIADAVAGSLPPSDDTPDDTTTDDDTVSSGTGLTGDECSDSTECASPRTCKVLDGVERCLPPTPTLCADDTDCVEGEFCATTENGEICASESLINSSPPATGAPSTTETIVQETPTPVTSAPTTDAPVTTEALSTTESSATTESLTNTTSDTGSIPLVPGFTGDSNSSSPSSTDEADSEDAPAPSGLTLDPCQDSDECQGSRSCRNTETVDLCDGGDCRCLPTSVNRCEEDSECDDGEGCLAISDVLDLPFLSEEDKEVSACISRAAKDSLVCIAAHSLGHLSREELVFEKDAVAHVLCDANESCATPGHMVQYKGNGMMMKSYCELTGDCVRKVMRVNSPRYSRGLTVPSKTEDLVFTALAARFETRAEEGVLSTAVRFGF